MSLHAYTDLIKEGEIERCKKKKRLTAYIKNRKRIIEKYQNF